MEVCFEKTKITVSSSQNDISSLKKKIIEAFQNILSNCMSVCQPLSVSICFLLYLCAYLSVSDFLFFPIFQSLPTATVYLSPLYPELLSLLICLSVSPSVCQNLSVSICLLHCLYAYLSVCLPPSFPFLTYYVYLSLILAQSSCLSSPPPPPPPPPSPLVSIILLTQ